MQPFSELPEYQFNQKMQPLADAILESLYPGCQIHRHTLDDGTAHILDQQYAIDCEITMPSGWKMTLQEKYRSHKFLATRGLRVARNCPDFTVEHMNAVGTKFESPGEWFRLSSQAYFLGWSNRSETGFAAWVLFDVCKAFLTIDQQGGLSSVGELRSNRGRNAASFYAIPLLVLKDSFIAVSNEMNVVEECRDCGSTEHRTSPWGRDELIVHCANCGSYISFTW